MANRRFEMYEYRQVLVRMRQGDSDRGIRRTGFQFPESPELAAETVVETYIELNEDEELRFAAEMQREGNKEVREMVVTWEEALAESRAEGKTEGEATLLKRQLVHRFRDLPEWAERRLQEASREELEGLAVRVVDAERLRQTAVALTRLRQKSLEVPPGSAVAVDVDALTADYETAAGELQGVLEDLQKWEIRAVAAAAERDEAVDDCDDTYGAGLRFAEGLCVLAGREVLIKRLRGRKGRR